LERAAIEPDYRDQLTEEERDALEKSGLQVREWWTILRGGVGLNPT